MIRAVREVENGADVRRDNDSRLVRIAGNTSRPFSRGQVLRKSPAVACVLAFQLLLAGCANGDFGRPKAWLVHDDIHDWVGVEVAAAEGIPPSAFPLTDDERHLRDLAYPLIEPPYDRNRWYSILNEYGLTEAFHPDAPFDDTAYGSRLLAKPYRSANGRYAKLNEDIRNDVIRIDPFFAVARRVLDLDSKRVQSMAYVSRLTKGERFDAAARNSENTLVVAWVQCSLRQRAASFRYALEHLVVATPSPVAVDVERSLRLLEVRIGENRLVAEPYACPVPVPAVAQAVPPGRIISK